uniref:Far upstream element-binding protein C-terminal domain-containing protein n=1 Tax=Acrobeloides nanus TaxID=290746 RepID=A0A914C2A9_9BILA
MYPNGDSAVMTQQQSYSYVNMNQQLDYRPDWINFYRQVGNHEVADQIEKEMYEQKGHLILGQGVCVQTSFPIPAQQNLINGTNHSQGLQ